MKTIEEDYSKSGIFDESTWYKWKIERFQDAIGYSRLAKQLSTLQKDYPQWKLVVTRLLQSNENRIDEASDIAMPMVKAGLLVQAPGTSKFTFANPAVRLLLLKKTLDPLICSTPFIYQ